MNIKIKKNFLCNPMRTLLSLSLALLMLLPLLCGCNIGGRDQPDGTTGALTPPPPPVSDTSADTTADNITIGDATTGGTPATDTTPGDTTATDTAGDPPLPPTPPVPTLSSLFPESAVPSFSPDKTSLYRETSRGSGFYEIVLPGGATSGDYGCMSVGGGVLLIDCSDYTDKGAVTRLYTYDAASGRLLGNFSAPAGNSLSMISVTDDGHIVALSEDEHIVTVFSSDFSSRKDTDIATAAGDDFKELAGIMISGDGNFAAILSDDGKSVCLVALSGSGTTPDVRLVDLTVAGDGSNLYFDNTYGALIYMGSYGASDEDTYEYVLDTSDKSLRRTFRNNGTFRSDDGLAINYYDVGMKIIYPDEPNTIAIIPMERDGESNIDASRAVIVSSRWDLREQVLLYDLSRRLVYTAYTDSVIPVDYTLSDAVWCDLGCVFVSCSLPSGAAKFYLWDFRDSSLDAPEEFEIELYTDTTLEEMSDDIVTGIADLGPVRVFSGSQGNDFSASDYLAYVCKDPILTYIALRNVAGLLSSYPAGIFDEMCVDGITGIDIYLCGTIHGISSSGISSAAGLTFTEYPHRSIALDIGNPADLRTNLAHELMHVMEDRLIEYDDSVDADMLDTWKTFVPKGESFYFSYRDKNGNEVSDWSYTAGGGYADSKVWFIDAYSKTHPHEDRARILEHLVMGDVGTPESSVRGEHLLMKARYLCAILRAAFPSVAASDDVIWERGIELIPGEFVFEIKKAA